MVIDPATGTPVPAKAVEHERCAPAAAQVAVALLTAPPVLPWQASALAPLPAVAAPRAPRGANLPAHLPRGPPLPA